MHRLHKGLAALQVALLGLMFLIAAAPNDGDLKVDSITVGSGQNKVVIEDGYLKARGATFTSPGSFGSVAIASNSTASGVWVQETPNRFAALTAVKAIGPALEVSSGKPRHGGDEFAVFFEGASDSPTVQILGTDGKLHHIQADRLSLLEGKPKAKSPKPYVNTLDPDPAKDDQTRAKPRRAWSKEVLPGDTFSEFDAQTSIPAGD